MFFFLFIRQGRNKQANENTNIHYEYTHDKWCTVAYLKKQVEKKTDYTKQQQTQKIYIDREREKARYMCFILLFK
jgi:hypothetical protein